MTSIDVQPHCCRYLGYSLHTFILCRGPENDVAYCTVSVTESGRTAATRTISEGLNKIQFIIQLECLQWAEEEKERLQ